MDTNLQTQLDADLNKSFVHNLQGKDYIAGYIAIEQANRIFGYENWSYTLTAPPELHKETDQLDKPYWYVTAQVKTKVVIKEGNTTTIVTREDVGYSEVSWTKQKEDYKTKELTGGRPQIEVAYKGAVTDALKRALRAWGNQFGNSLYDREDKLGAVQATLSTADEVALAKYVQKILDAKTQAELDETLDGLVQLSKQEDWSKAKLDYIRQIATRAKAGIDARAKRQAERATA